MYLLPVHEKRPLRARARAYSVCVYVCARAPSRRKVVGTERRRGSAGGAGGKTTARRRDRRWNGRLLGGGGGKRPGRAAGRREIAEGMITGYHRGDQPASSRGDFAGCARAIIVPSRERPHQQTEGERERGEGEGETISLSGFRHDRASPPPPPPSLRSRKLWRRLDGVAALRLAAVIAAAFRLDWTGLQSAPGFAIAFINNASLFLTATLRKSDKAPLLPHRRLL